MAVGSVKPLSLPTPFRPHDYAYDPLFVVSGPKDHYKAALLAKLSTAKFQICPIFANMFSDLPNHPRKQYIRRKSAHLPPSGRSYKSRLQPNLDQLYSKKPDVIGADRAKYFHFPKTSIGGDLVPELQLHYTTPRDKSPSVVKVEPKNQNKKIQTEFRESSVQTSPWEPSFVFKGDTPPELLKLDFLKWGSGLPPGMHEVQLLERARMKRAWEERCEVRTAEDLEKRRTIIAAMERDEWAFREQEIQDIQDLRLKLLEKMLNELHEKSKNRSEAKLRMFAEMKYAEKEQKLKKLRDKTKRELRKLDLKHAGIEQKYHSVNIVEEHGNHASEIYGPLMRHGEHPKRWHLVIDEALTRFKAQFAGVEDFNTLPTWLNRATKIKDCMCLKMKGTRLCMRETKWTAPVLKKLHEELLALRKHDLKPCTLIKKIQTPPSAISTPEVEGIPDGDEDFYQAMVLIQSIIKGRAAQMHIYEGRERCRELIQELKYSSGLLVEENVQIHDYKLKIKLQQRNEQIALEKLFRLRESLDELQSSVVGSLLDFLNKELRRLLEERRAHAICILLERERYDREAAEAGRRQVELRRRREHDEMFKQIVKIQQETVDLYLEDIIKESMEFTSEEEARMYIEGLARKIDEEAYRIKEATNITINDEEEIVADLVHHFVVPEVQKQIIRQKIQRKQREKLRAVHDSVYSEIEEVNIIQVPEQSDQTSDQTDQEYNLVGSSKKFRQQSIPGGIVEDRHFSIIHEATHDTTSHVSSEGKRRQSDTSSKVSKGHRTSKTKHEEDSLDHE
ncbi:cilia- and flagella-associated protein 91-like isoform X2 [Tribolium madens]|uniref:cilia- and flagella-associated protein 91-like isoform X2 n=1 Tax=Tribolium madens TaxID=41895 RepID=UPI001CF72697|nr:cilia- and flagella-associated protein 91-like isoform X2 [Tribolium madens]